MWVLACQIQEFRILRKNIEQAWSMFLFVCFFFCPFISFLFLIPPTSLQNLTRLLSCRNKFGNNNSLERGIANGMSIQIHQSVLWILCFDCISQENLDVLWNLSLYSCASKLKVHYFTSGTRTIQIKLPVFYYMLNLSSRKNYGVPFFYGAVIFNCYIQ